MTTSAPTVRRSELSGFDELFSARVLIVTGKGGVGKTTTAASLALAAAGSGRRTLLVEVEGRQGLSRSFRTQPWDYEEREFRPGLHGTAVDPEDSMYEYLDMYYGLRRMSWVMSRTNAIDFVTAAAPGLRDLLLIGKIYEIEQRRRDDGRMAYDLIVLDAPPTGRIVPFLRAPEAVTEIVRVGPIKRQSGQITEMLEDPDRCAVVLTTLLEEMPVTEAIESIEDLQREGIALGPVVANRTLTPRFDGDEADAVVEFEPARVVEIVEQADLRLTETTAATALVESRGHLRRAELEEQLRARLREETGLPMVELPLLTGATFDEDDLEVLADVIAASVGEPGPRAERP